MSPVSHRNRRRAYRLRAELPVMFAINDGAMQTAHAIDLTYRSIALRSGHPVHTDDRAVVRVSALPPLNGRVVRIFDGGFAVGGGPMSLSLVAYAKTNDLSEFVSPAVRCRDRVISPVFTVQADFPAWARLTASRHIRGRSDRHFLSILIAEDLDPDNVRSVWVASDEAIWCARIVRFRKRGAETMLTIVLNGLQMAKGANCGLSLKIVETSYSERILTIETAHLKAHANNFRPRKLAV